MMRYMNCSFSPIDGARLLLPLDPFSMEFPLLLPLAAAALLFALPRKPFPPPPTRPAITAEVGTFSRRIEMATGPRLSSNPNQFWCSGRRINQVNNFIFVKFCMHCFAFRMPFPTQGRCAK